ncbi:MAG TPA: aldo/keto reductase [Gaiellaceae bacterium]|nr:aldo/keto reductase [Gaiellaceae bacterium]
MSRPHWLDATELRIGLGCMRLSTDEERDEQRAVETITAAAAAGVTVFDTAHAYGRGESELGHNERLLARALRGCGAGDRRIVTKGGMARTGGGWFADGRAKSILRDCEASLDALDGLQIDLYLLHAPDPRTPWATSLRALGRLLDDGLVRRVGVSNVNRTQLDEALSLIPVSAVQVALSPFADRAVRGGVVERCEAAGVAVIAHSPLGGAERAARLARDPALTAVAAAHGATPAEVVLAWLLALSPTVVPIPGARRSETARSAAGAAALALGAAERRTLSRAFEIGGPARRKKRTPQDDAEVVLVMGIPGAGKTRIAAELAARGYVRLNRDERGGSLRSLAEALDDALSSGTRRVVLDNTYLTRAARSHAIEAATRHAVPVRCVWLETPLAQAQVNLVERLLDRFGALPTPAELRVLARREPGLLLPTSQMRALRELEPPALDEGLSGVEHVEFARQRDAARSRPGVFVAAAAAVGDGWRSQLAEEQRDAPLLVFDWSPDGSSDALDAAVERVQKADATAAGALCPHGGGPPTCWCRPPLPGLLLAFARAHAVDPSRSALVGTGPAHRTLATTLGARYVTA